MERNNHTFSLNFVTNDSDNVCRLQYWNIDSPIPEVVGDSSVLGLFRVLYFWRGTPPIVSWTQECTFTVILRNRVKVSILLL